MHLTNIMRKGICIGVSHFQPLCEPLCNCLLSVMKFIYTVGHQEIRNL